MAADRITKAIATTPICTFSFTKPALWKDAFMKRIPAILFGLSILTLIFVTNVSSQAKPARTPRPPYAYNMTCPSKPLDPQSRLTVQMPWPHGGYLVIGAPDGDYYYISFGAAPDDIMQPIISNTIFTSMKSISLPVATQKGYNWHYNRQPAKRIFTRNGRYRLMVAQEMETEDPIYDGICEFDYYNPADHRPVRRRPWG
jgi:hypothetical protein